MFHITADYVSIEGFTINDAIKAAGIRLETRVISNVPDDSASNAIITDNLFINDGLVVTPAYLYQNIVENNTVNGKPLVYLENASDRVITNAGQVVLVNCESITIKDLDLSYTSIGIQLFKSNNCTITGNGAIEYWYGTINPDRTWHKYACPHRLTGTVSVSAATWTVDPGVEVRAIPRPWPDP